jgi:regulator of protease activity HflC (stomatin/prohibitin superfamily)
MARSFYTMARAEWAGDHPPLRAPGGPCYKAVGCGEVGMADERNVVRMVPRPGWGATLRQIWEHPLFRSAVLPILLLVLAAKLLAPICFTYVAPNEYGIKVVQVGILSKRGVHSEVYETGYHFVLRPFGIERMFLFPKDIQVLDLTGAREEAAQEAKVTKPAHIQTSDGFFVDVDVSILYRVKDPYAVFTLLGPGRLFESNGILPKAEPFLKQTLGELTTEEFYNSVARTKKTEMAREMLDKELEAYGLEVKQVLVRYFRYTEEIQRNIEEKKLKDQLVFKNQAEGRAAIEGALLKKSIQEGQATIDVKLQEGRAYITRKEAERDLYVRSKRAEADLLIKLAEAKKTQLRNDALQGAGSDRMVGLKLAEVYKGLELVVLPSDGPNGVNPLDLDRTMRLLEVKRPEGGR